MIDVAGKNITVMGLGLLGRGVNVCKFLLEHGVAHLTITDLKSAEQLFESIKELKEYEDRITYVLERHRLQDFVEADLVVKAAGVPLDNKYIAAAHEKNIPVKMDASWAVSSLPKGVITIGVTGTKGKSTVSHLIAHILNEALGAGQLGAGKVYLGGNVRGQATLPLLDKIKSGDYLVLELDSWQLQGFHDEKISPHLAIFTNFMPDHLNYYKGMPEYYFDKSAIYKYQTKDDFLVFSPSSFEAWQKYDKNTKPAGKVAIVKQSILMKDWQFNMPGEHNRLNAAQAYQVTKFLDIDDAVIKSAVASFKGVEGRLQLIATKKGVDFYNDTNATTPEATALSIKALHEKYGKLIVICGGVSKQFPTMKPLIEALNSYSSAVVLFPGGIADQIKNNLKVPMDEASAMGVAVEKAAKLARDQGSKAVIMSPAGSSFGMFINEYDRGEQFNKALRDL